MPEKTLETIINGGTKRINKLPFLYVEKSLGELDYPHLLSFIHRHKKQLTPRRLAKRFPNFKGINAEEYLFFDIETCGLEYKHPIISIATAEIMEDDLRARCLVARDYSEEAPVLAYFFSMLKEYRAFFTFNGTAFDMPRITSRAIQNGVMNNSEGFGKLSKILGERHVDLFLLPELKRRIKLSNYRLSTIEASVIGIRGEDIPSVKIPKAYRDFVFGQESSDERMARVIRHNMLDASVLPAVLAYILC